MDKIYFLILNYKTKKETENCINTIQKLAVTGYEVNIVVIDNASEDDSYAYLKKLYINDERVEIYQMESNMGFSKANNYGYSLIRSRGDYAFIIVCNSDIEFCQHDFLERLLREYEKTQFHLAGPCVYCESNKTNFCRGYQSPAYPYEWKKWYVLLRENACCMKLNKINHVPSSVIERLLGGGYTLIDTIIKIIVRTVYVHYREIRHEDVPIHGSCIVLSKLFVDREERLFYPETQFYGEELLLYLRTQRNAYKVVYNPEMLVYHMQGRATKQLGQGKEVELFRISNLRDAARAYLDEIKKFPGH